MHVLAGIDSETWGKRNHLLFTFHPLPHHQACSFIEIDLLAPSSGSCFLLTSPLGCDKFATGCIYEGAEDCG